MVRLQVEVTHITSHVMQFYVQKMVHKNQVKTVSAQTHWRPASPPKKANNDFMQYMIAYADLNWLNSGLETRENKSLLKTEQIERFDPLSRCYVIPLPTEMLEFKGQCLLQTCFTTGWGYSTEYHNLLMWTVPTMRQTLNQNPSWILMWEDSEEKKRHEEKTTPPENCHWKKHKN